MNFVTAIVFIFLISASSIAKAEYNSELLKIAAGGYIITTYLLEVLSKSECGYVLANKKFSIDSAIGEVKSYFAQKDIAELNDFLKSNKFIRDLRQTEEMVYGVIRGPKPENIDSKTFCGMLTIKYLEVYQQVKSKWDYAKSNYSK